MSVTAASVKELREKTGCGMMDCKNALEESQGDLVKAVDYLRKSGLEMAKKRGGRETSQGLVSSYIHHNGRIGVMLEINCETDFVARNELFQELIKDLCMHICGETPTSVSRDDLDADVVAKEREILIEQAKGEGKPAEIAEKIVEGRMKKFYQEHCLLEQKFSKDDSITVEQRVKDAIGKLGENIVVRRFARFELGA